MTSSLLAGLSDEKTKSNEEVSPMLHHHMADHGVIFQRVGAHVLAVAALLQPAMWHFVGQHEMGVDLGGGRIIKKKKGNESAQVAGP